MSEPETPTGADFLVCSCPQCRWGLWCKDGQRGVFERGVDTCKREGCELVAWQHSTKAPRPAPGCENAAIFKKGAR